MSVSPLLRCSPAVICAALSGLLLSGCSVTGTYQDATDSNAAKLRFVANTDNATMDYYDAEHCDGLTTGLLNNLFIPDSNRRAGMMVAPPEKARGYLEIKLPPEKDLYLNVNTQVGYAVCGYGFNFKPERGSEYELTLSVKGRHCSTLLQQVQRIDGKDLRTPIPMKREGLEACAGRGIFPKTLVQLPDTPERTAMIDRIVEASLFVAIKSDLKTPTSTSFSPDKIDSMVSERKGKIRFELPDEYWTLYRQNLFEFTHESDAIASEAMARTSDEYRKRLRSIDDQQLKAWSAVDGTSGKRGNVAPTEMETAMIQFYYQSAKEEMAEASRRHLDRMARLEAQYDVCSRYRDCWTR